MLMVSEITASERETVPSAAFNRSWNMVCSCFHISSSSSAVMSRRSAASEASIAFGSSTHLGMLEEAETTTTTGGGGANNTGMAVPRGMPSAGEAIVGSPSYLWSSGESCFGGSTPPGLMSDSSFAETESSEDDDFTAGLAEQMAHSMLDDSDDNSSGSLDRTGLWGESGWNPVQLMGLSSPVGESNWSTGCWSSGYSSSSSKVSSPPSTPGAVDDGWDAVVGTDAGGNFYVDEKGVSGGYGAVGSNLAEVQWRNNAFSDSRNGASLPVLTKPYAAVVNPRRGWNLKEDDRRPPPSQQSRSSRQPPVGLWNRQHSQVQPQHQPPPCLPGTPRSGYRSGGGVSQRPLGPPWQAPPAGANGSVMRAVFLGGSTDRSSCGTGVFLPRSSNDYSKRKTSCSSVLLPSRIVQVLNLNVDDMRCQPSAVQSGASVPGNGGGDLMAGSLNCPADEVWSSNSQWKTYTMCSELHQSAESTLPTEWSY